VGALRTLADAANPARLRLVAGGMRSIMEELRRVAGVERSGAGLAKRVEVLEALWKPRRPTAAEGVDDEFIRELDSFFADYQLETNEAQARLILQHLDVSRRDDVAPIVAGGRARQWVLFLGLFNRVLHGSQSMDEAAFGAELERFERFLLDLLAPRPLKDIDRIDELVAAGIPATDELAKELVELATRRPTNHGYFFDALDDPAWLAFLEQHRFFAKPILPIERDGWVRYPNWPESQFLVRLVARAPDDVFTSARGIAGREAENPRVHEDIIRIAARLPGTQAAELGKREAKWLRSQRRHLMSLPGSAGELVGHLAREDELAAVYALAGALLRIVSSADPIATGRRRAVPVIERFYYEEILDKYWPAVAERDPAGALKFLCHRLDDLVRLGFTEKNGYDGTTIWRPAIESDRGNLSTSLLDLLVNSVRDSAAALEDPEEALEVFQRLERPLFKRLALDLLRRRGTREAVAEALADQVTARDNALGHEYGELLRARFGDLSGGQQAAILATIAAGSGAALTPELEERGVTPDDVALRDRHWRLQRYDPIAEHLDGEARSDYEALLAELGPPSEPGLRVMRGRGGDEPVFSEDELATMGPAGVVAALRDAPGPVPLSSVVAADPVAYAEHAGEFESLDPTYVRALVSGLTEAAKGPIPFPWGPVLALSGWVVAQPVGEKVTDDWDRDPGWGWTRRQIVSLLEQGFSDAPAGLPIAERDAAWAVLAELAEDRDPDPTGPDPDSDFARDAITQSINSVRGTAMHAAVRYARWVERVLGDEFAGMDSVPEFRARVERHLDAQVDRAPAVRSVFGQWFVQFVRMDEGWARSIAPRVFPSAPEEGTQFAAAWSAYVIISRSYAQLLEILGDAYARAVDQLSEASFENTMAGDPREHLGDHLFHFRILGALEGDDDLFARFWTAAGPELRRAVIQNAGWALEQTPELTDEMRAEIEATWDWIVANTRDGDTAPLAAFGAWIDAPGLDPAWRLERAREVLSLGVRLWPENNAYEAAARCANKHPVNAVWVIRGMVETDAEGWPIQAAEAEIRTALVAALANEDARDDAEAVVELLAARGLLGFRDLL
jgi:hypothetical protein